VGEEAAATGRQNRRAASLEGWRGRRHLLSFHQTLRNQPQSGAKFALLRSSPAHTGIFFIDALLEGSLGMPSAIFRDL
jgi:hypothetical protein